MCDGLCLVAQSCPTLCDTLDCSPPGSSVHGDSPGKNTGVGCHVLLQVCDGLEEQYSRKACSMPNPELGFGDTLISIPAQSLCSPGILNYESTFPNYSDYGQELQIQTCTRDLLACQWGK